MNLDDDDVFTPDNSGNVTNDSYNDTDNIIRKERERKLRKKKAIKDEIISYVKIIVTTVVVTYLLLTFVIINAYIPSTSMQNGLNVGDRLIGFRLAYVFSEPARGDVAIFRYPDDEEEIFIKRIIGLPGEVVRVANGHVYVGPDVDHLIQLEEDYIAEPMINDGTSTDYYVPEGYYFMLGDNRNHSKDSRLWNNTYVAKDKILAKAMFRYWPPFSAVK